MRTMAYPRLDETVYGEELPNGLQVYVLRKEGFRKIYSTFTTKYGSIDNHFRVEGREEFRVPDGIAHFLEHKMFEEPTGDVFAAFASKGASVNAYTSFDRTSYLFSATDNIRENLTTLINFVQNPYFTDENVEKEKGIIGQEIKMYQDHPDWRSYFGLIEAMYTRHPVHIDIAGTVESIAKITKETLYDCYRTFYHPSNMSLFVVGGVNPEEIINLVKENQAGKSFEPQGAIHRYFEAEPPEVKERRRTIHLPVSLPKCLFGFKEIHTRLDGNALLRKELATKLVLDALFSPSSEMYQKLYDEKLITDSFGHEYNIAEDYAFSVLGGDTPDPERMLERVREETDRLLERGLPEEALERSRRKKIGGFLRMLNSPEAIAGEFTKYRFKGSNLFDMLSVYETITLEEANARFREHVQWEQLAVSLVTSERT